MNTILELLKKINPGIANNKLFRIVEYVVLALLLYGLYVDFTGNLTNSNNLIEAKTSRDEQLKGYAVQLGIDRHEIYDLKDEVAGLRNWNKSMTERNKVLEQRIHRLEDRALKGR